MLKVFASWFRWKRDTNVVIRRHLFFSMGHIFVGGFESTSLLNGFDCTVNLFFSSTFLNREHSDSAWKSSLGTAKRPGLDWTQTGQDRKFPRPSKTVTAVQSSVSQDFGNFKTDERLVLTG